ncbi:MAG: Gp37 family protein [Alistipes sp.]|nr:Gp37 family protein [Alistipes sp.]
MIVYEKYEDEIVGLLKARVKKDSIVVMPAPSEKDLNDPKITSKPQLYVIISGDDWDDPENIGVTSQLVTVKGEVFIKSKDRRGPNGVFALYDYVVKTLLGVKLSGAESEILFNRLSFVHGLQNSWQYAATFTFDVRRIETQTTEL